jgi:hypothetical protein
MNTTELLTEPELTPALEAFFETQTAYQKAINVCSWSMSLESFYSTWYNDNAAEKIAQNWEKLNNRAAEIETAVILGTRLEDFVNAGFDVLAHEYSTARYRWQEQQRDIAEAPYRAWAMAYNARLSELDKQIKGAKIRRGKVWSKWRKDEIDYQTALTLSNALDLEIVAMGVRREQVAAEKFESVVA